MKTKPIHALLLSLVVAGGGGAATGDAYAQSNTDRLVQVVATANDNNSLLQAIQAVLDGLGDRLAAVSAAIRGLTADLDALDERTATTTANVDGLTAKTDALNSRATELSSKTDAISARMDGLTSKTDAAAARATELSSKTDALGGLTAKTDATNVHAAELAAKTDAANAHATELASKTDAVSAKVDAAGMHVEAAMAAANQSLETAKGMSGTCCSKMAVIADELLPKLQADADGISEAVTGDRRGAELILRMNSIEENVDRRADAIENTLGGIAERLDVVQDKITSVPAPLPGVETATIEATVDTSHYAQTVSKPASDNIYNYNFDFTCKSGVFVQKVEVTPITIMNNTGNTTLAGSGTTTTTTTTNTGGGTPAPVQCTAANPCGPAQCFPPTPVRDCAERDATALCIRYACYVRQLPRDGYDANPFGPDVLKYGNLTQRSTITAHGMPLLDTKFDPNPNDPNNAPVRLHQPATFDLFELSPGTKLKTKTTMNATSLTINAKVFDGARHNNITFFDHGALAGVNGTLSNAVKLDLYKIKATVLAVGDHGCQFGVGGSDVYGKEQSILLSVIGQGNLVKSFKTALDCNDKPTRIIAPSKIQFNFGGTVSSEFTDLASLTLKAGGKSMEFEFDKTGTPKPKANTATSLVWEKGGLDVSGAIPIVQGALIKVTYETVPGNTCAEAK